MVCERCESIPIVSQLHVHLRRILRCVVCVRARESILLPRGCGGSMRCSRGYPRRRCKRWRVPRVPPCYRAGFGRPLGSPLRCHDYLAPPWSSPARRGKETGKGAQRSERRRYESTPPPLARRDAGKMVATTATSLAAPKNASPRLQMRNSCDGTAAQRPCPNQCNTATQMCAAQSEAVDSCSTSSMHGGNKPEAGQQVLAQMTAESLQGSTKLAQVDGCFAARERELKN